MRGKGRKSRRRNRRDRITPAYAGKSNIVETVKALPGDHPRLCGEKWHIGHSITRQKGSPPPMRGKDLAFDKSVPADRITPAYAGKSWMHFMIFFFTRDHPRLCGEKWRESISTKYVRGSPPPMRGKGFRAFPSTSKYRITPAYAGKRLYAGTKRKGKKDHPRLCGEK